MTFRTAVVLVLTSGLFALVLFRPIRDVDMFWQVKTGDLMLERGDLIRTDPFTSTHAGEPTPTIYWLSQLFYAGLLRIGSWELLHRLDALLFAGSLGLTLLVARTPRQSLLAAVGAFALGLLVALPHHGLRPQTFGILGFAVMVALFHSRLGSRSKLLALFVVCTVWQNLHPSVSMGALYLATVTAGQLGRWVMAGARGPLPWTGLLAVGIAGLAIFLTPEGVGIIPLSAKNAAIARSIGVEEWLPAWDPVSWPAMRIFWVAVGVTLLLTWTVRSQGTWEDYTVLLVMTGAAILVCRMSLFWVVAMMPIWARWIELSFPAMTRLSMDDPPRLGRSWGLAGLGVFIAAMVAFVVRPPVFDRALPFAGLAELRERRVSGTVYNYREWAGPLIWSAHPDVKVTIDGRLYLFPPADWEQYVSVALGEIPLEEVEARYHPDAFFLRPSYHRRFIPLIRASGRWQEAYADDHCILFVKATP